MNTYDERLTFTVMEEGGDELETIVIDVVVGWTPGTSETGRFGPPEDYDPGSGDEFWFEAITSPNGPPSPLAVFWAECWLKKNEERIAEHLGDEDRGECDAAAYDRWKDERATFKLDVEE